MQNGPSANAPLINILTVPSLNCPSSPLLTTEQDGTYANGTVNFQLINYVGITGSYWRGGTNNVVSSSPSASSYGAKMYDGSVRFLSQEIDFCILTAMADRGDNTAIAQQ